MHWEGTVLVTLHITLCILNNMSQFLRSYVLKGLQYALKLVLYLYQLF